MTLLDFIFPKQCVSCGAFGAYICKKCHKQIIPIAPNECICPMCGRPAISGRTHPRCRTKYSLDGLTSFFYYKDAVRHVITSIKYSFVRDMATELVSTVPFTSYEIRALQGDPNSLVIPIPLHDSRLRFRGFNQSALLGEIVASRLQIAYSSEVLRRITKTAPQVQMKQKEDRFTNIAHAFAISSTLQDIENLNILLFDDVFTTGATLREAANTLKRGGARNVWGVTIAR